MDNQTRVSRQLSRYSSGRNGARLNIEVHTIRYFRVHQTYFTLQYMLFMRCSEFLITVSYDVQAGVNVSFITAIHIRIKLSGLHCRGLALKTELA